MSSPVPLPVLSLITLALGCGGKPADSAADSGDAPPAPYFDEDRDGYTEDVDCDDNNDRVFPGAREGCDDIDNDCDEIVDEDPSDAPTWYADADGDGFGDQGSTVEECEEPEGYTSRAGDCDDGESETSPEAQEVCGDGVDNNCAGGDAPCGWEGEIGLPDADAVITGQLAGGRAGCSVAAGSGGELLIGACEADGAGMAYVLRSPIVSGSLEDAYARLEGGGAGDSLGAAAVGLEVDGALAWAVGAPGGDRAGGDSGEVYLLSGPQGVVDVGEESAGALYGSAPAEGAGRALAADGDLLVVGAPLYEEPAAGGDTGGPGPENAGAAWLIRGIPEGPQGLDEAAYARLDGEAASDNAGRAVAAGDFDGDGVSDVLLGAWRSDAAGEDAGAAYLALGPFDGPQSLADAEVLLLGEDSRQGAGFAVSAVGDIDGDGTEDFAVGAPQSRENRAYLFTGVPAGELSLGAADVRFYSAGEPDEAGYDIGGGDIDGDGYGDLVIGAPGSQLSAGGARLALGPLEGAVDLATQGLLVGGAAGDRAGESLEVSDLDGDGAAEVIIGAPGARQGTRESGAVYVLFGGE